MKTIQWYKLKIVDLIFRVKLSCLGLSLFLIGFCSPLANAQNAVNEKEINFSTTFDELRITLYLDNGYSFETDVIISDSNLIYFNVEDVFKNLKIKCLSTSNSLTGFIENESNLYAIDFEKKQIKVGTRSISIAKGVVEELGINYVESSLLSQAFGFTIVFNPRSLSAKLTANFELPFVKQLRMEKSRNTIAKLQGKPIIADTIVARAYHLFKFGMVDWALSSFQTVNNSTNNAISVGVGTELLFGEANVSINYNDQYKFDRRQLQYSWRWIDNSKKIIKQAQAGRVFSQSISFLNAPLLGVTVSNSPNTVRKASGNFAINDYTEPNWTIELYINDVLVDYTLADALGLYVFNVPIVYGYTTLKLKFYGPLGEERTEERIMNTPYTFVPAKNLEYSVTSGIVQDGTNSRFGQGNFNYGVSRFLTVGGGLEYLSSIPDRPFIPFGKVAFQPFSKMVLNLEYAHDVSVKGLLNFYFTKSAFLEVDYSKFVEGQLATRFNALEERKIRFSFPYKTKNSSGFARFNFNQFIYRSFNYNQFDMVLSGYYKQFSINSQSLINWVGATSPFVTTNLAVSYRYRNNVLLRPSAEYNLNSNRLVRFRGEIEKRVSRMYFSASYERIIQSKSDNVFISFKYDLPFARIGISSFYSNSRMNFSQIAQGSLAFGGDNKYVHTGNNSAISKGGLLFYPFFDLNQNGALDKGEKMVLLPSARVSGGTAVISKKDFIIRISDLNAFVNYTVEFSDTDLDNISWRFKHNTYEVLVDPNQYKRVFVPIVSVGEVSGMVRLISGQAMKGQGRINLEIYDKKGKKVAETLSESDGYFSYLGLKPGEYIVRVDEAQLDKLKYQSVPAAHPVVIKISEEGDIVEGLDFKLKSI